MPHLKKAKCLKLKHNSETWDSYHDIKKLIMSGHKQVGSVQPLLLFKKDPRIFAPYVADVEFYHNFEITALNAS